MVFIRPVYPGSRNTGVTPGAGELAQADSANQLGEAGVAANRIEVWMGFEELQDIRLLLVGFSDPVEGLLVVVKTKISIHKRSGRNVACLSASLKFIEEPERVAVAPGVG